jgi:hypothetical protein
MGVPGRFSGGLGCFPEKPGKPGRFPENPGKSRNLAQQGQFCSVGLESEQENFGGLLV